MKTALLLPGYLDSPDYLHMVQLDKMLQGLGYKTHRLDPCGLWKTGNGENYTITNYIKDIENLLASITADEVVLVGHSLGGFVAIIAGEKFSKVTKVVALCPPANRDRSNRKWPEKGVRVSERGLPEDPSQARKFTIPYSYVEDNRQYSSLKSIRNLNKPTMILIALDDTVVFPEETEDLVNNAINPHVIRVPNMGHDFRHSEEETAIVVNHVKNWLCRTD